jgi:ubiquinone/menaquinone biosynthesis C-methylase UbiE
VSINWNCWRKPATIAPRYDFITRFLSFGQDRRWKRRLLDLSDVAPRALVLDLACGTGDLAWSAIDRGAFVVGVDITPGMLVLARAKGSAKSWATSISGGKSKPAHVTARCSER